MIPPNEIKIQAWERAPSFNGTVTNHKCWYIKETGCKPYQIRRTISTIGPHGRLCFDYYVLLNEVLDMTDLVNPNAVSIRSEDFHL